MRILRTETTWGLRLTAHRFGYMLIAALVGLLVALGYVYYVQPNCGAWCDTMHADILAGTAPAPFRFRLLGTWLSEVMPGDGRVGMALAHLAVTPTVWALIWMWLAGEKGERAALIGVTLLSAAMLAGYRMYGVALYSMLEVGFLATGLLMLRYRVPIVWYLALVAAGTLNRETTGAMLVLLLLAVNRKPFTAVLVWGAVMVGLRLVLGDGTAGQSLLDIVNGNLMGARLLPTLLNHAALLPFAALTVMGWSTASPLARRRMLVVGLPYAAAVLAFGYWDEVRLWLPVLMLALPIISIERSDHADYRTDAGERASG